MSVLRWSYDNLLEQERSMFVDVTCMFYKESVREALAYWKSCKGCTSCGGVPTVETSLRNLVNKNMVTLGGAGAFFKVHDLMIELGQEIGMRAKTHFVKEGFAEAKIVKEHGCRNLLTLNLSGCTSITKLPNSIGQSSRLGFLYLDGCSKLRKLPESIGQLKALVCLFLLHCTSLKALPDAIGQFSRLKSLDLDDCKKLDTLPESLGQLKALVDLNLWSCSSLKALPDSIGAVSNLQKLCTYGCTFLVKLPPSIRLFSRLERLLLEFSPECQTISHGSVEAWTQLRDLCLVNCCGLGSLIDYGALICLENLDLEDNTLIELPKSIGLLMCLKYLTISCEMLQCLPKSITNLKMLSFLTLRNCANLKRLPKTLGALTSLTYLFIYSCSIRRLPSSIGQLSRLEELLVSWCKNLQKLPTSIRHLKGLRKFQLYNCGSIEAMGALTTLQGLPIWGSTSTTKLPASLGIASNLVVCGPEALDNLDHFLVGRSQVLEEDESGSLTANCDELSGQTILLRVAAHKKQ